MVIDVKARMYTAQKEWYEKNKEYHKQKVRARKRHLKYRLDNYKQSLACCYCGEHDAACLDFHHLRDKKGNVYTMANNGVGWEMILAEIKKCIIVCANCHAKLEYEKNMGLRGFEPRFSGDSPS